MQTKAEQKITIRQILADSTNDEIKALCTEHFSDFYNDFANRHKKINQAKLSKALIAHAEETEQLDYLIVLVTPIPDPPPRNLTKPSQKPSTLYKIIAVAFVVLMILPLLWGFLQSN